MFSRYEVLSGQKVNFDKSEIFVSRGCPASILDETVDVLHVKVSDGSLKYLGFPLVVKNSKSACFHFFVDRI